MRWSTTSPDLAGLAARWRSSITRVRLGARRLVARRLGGSLVWRVLLRYHRCQGGTWATIVAWNAFFAFFPIVLLVVAGLGIVLHDPHVRRLVEDQVVAAFPSCRAAAHGRGSCAVLEALDTFRTRSGEAGVVALVGLLWSGSSLFGAIDRALAAIHGCAPRGFLRQKLMAIAMIAVFTLLAVPVVLSGSLLSLAASLPGVPQVLRHRFASWLIQAAGGMVASTALFAAIYGIVPNCPRSERRVLPGALVAAVLFEGFTLVFPLYFRLAGGFAAYGQSFALAALLLVFFWALGHIVVLGGAVNAEVGRGRRPTDRIAGADPNGGGIRGTRDPSDPA